MQIQDTECLEGITTINIKHKTTSYSYTMEKLRSGKPCKDRAETVELLESLCSGTRLSNVHGTGNPILVSDVPESCLKKNNTTGVILGIDEAGRGPVLGPMTYGCAFWHPDDSDYIPKGFTDSKQLSSNTRSSLFTNIKKCLHMGLIRLTCVTCIRDIT